MRYLTLICFLLSSLSFGDTDPYFATKDTVLKQDSWIFSPVKAKEVRDKLIDLDTLKQVNDSLNKQIELSNGLTKIQSDNLNLSMEQNSKLAKSLNEERSMTNWERGAWFFGGILATGLVFYGLGQVNK